MHVFFYTLLPVAALWGGVVLLPGNALANRITTVDLGIESGYRQDNLDWNMAGNLDGTSPNVLSELSWDDLKLLQVDARGRFTLGRPGAPVAFHARSNLGVGTIIDGSNQDSDYGGDNRTLEFSRSNNDTSDGGALDISIGLGPRFAFGGGALTLTPLFGYSYHGQYLRLSGGNQTVSNQDIATAVFGVDADGEPLVNVPPTGPFSGLDSSYDAHWWGPWLGLDLTLAPTAALTLTGSGEYHLADYLGEADWNLRTDLAHPVSFDHQADASGVVFALGTEWAFHRRWALTGRFGYQKWQTDRGLHRVFLADGTVGVTRLNAVNWESAALMVGARCRF
ncbi:hypothetical protein DSOUD_1504 [Desulfuromonas soudanensis]|uniref:Protochlamydia outer membrane protein domain-containing protein n=1 Tax=Desulfuromonas soudanensis TaxID=1603606 RepID=A0A0M3QFL6_9BACT|nr:hypothetical protein [Desulfuromonas soudanensis]ALC16283.1 hypothetical protein DSOUD_1504 [Desulfuromonas soudanensis]